MPTKAQCPQLDTGFFDGFPSLPSLLMVSKSHNLHTVRHCATVQFGCFCQYCMSADEHSIGA